MSFVVINKIHGNKHSIFLYLQCTFNYQALKGHRNKIILKLEPNHNDKNGQFMIYLSNPDIIGIHTPSC